ncbi:MAG: hypothetical protein Q7T51_04555 [Candidatus Moranbacteria bacterium]|nr:hypothetical protein [Candidatus Moranbacteria bacterium]
MDEEIKTENESVQEAEVEKIEKVAEVDFSEAEISPEEIERKKKTDRYIEFGLLFILGILVGIAIKTEATRRVTIGYDDWQMKIVKQDVDFNQMQLEVAKKSIEQQTTENQPAE